MGDKINYKILDTGEFKQNKEGFFPGSKHINLDYLYLVDGQVIKGLKELFEVLKIMDDNIFNYHVKGGVNDFANWVKYRFKQRYLARSLELAKDRETMTKILFIHQFV